tara:strand:- start:241 stop:1245 length:1005 start_codon:yes stop_codon:yes gene_type:complete
MGKVTVEVSAKNNVRAGLDAARADLNKWKKETEGGLKLERDSKVKSNLIGLAGDLTKATTSTEALAAAGARLADVFQNKLGTAIGIGIGVQVLGWIDEAQKGVLELKYSIEDLARGDQKTPGQEAGALRGQRDAIGESMRQKERAIENPGFLSSFKDSMMSLFGQQTSQEKAMGEYKKLQDSLLINEGQLLSRQQETATVLELRVKGENEAADAMERQLKHARELYSIQRDFTNPQARASATDSENRIFAAQETLIARKNQAEATKAQGGVVAGSLQEAGGGGRALSFFAGDTGQILREQLAVMQQVLYAIRSTTPGSAATSASIPIKNFQHKP